MKGENQKMNFYLPEDLLAWVKREAQRLDRPQSWIIEAACKLSQKKIERIPDPR